MSDICCRLYGPNDIRVDCLQEIETQEDFAVIRVVRGAICPIDLSYYETGKLGGHWLLNPIIPGCQAYGIVESAPSGSELKPDQLVVLSPLRPCEKCSFCQAGQYRHCQNIRFNGSAARVPYEDGFLRSRLSHPVTQCFPITANMQAEAATGVEPLAVCLHALSRAPSLEGKRVLITNAGVLGGICTALARLRGASEVIVTDVRSSALNIAEKMGADRTINMIETYDGLAEYMVDNGQVDIVLECSANSHTIAQSIRAAKPQSTIVQIAVGSTMPVAVNLLTTKELHVSGSYRFDTEFPEALRMICNGEIDLSPLVSHVLPAQEAKRAFELAANKDKSHRVQLDFAA